MPHWAEVGAVALIVSAVAPFTSLGMAGGRRAAVEPTPTTTLPPPFSTGDPCACMDPTPEPTDCALIHATLEAGYRHAFASQTAFAGGTPTRTASPTHLPTEEATPTLGTPTSAATATATDPPSATATATEPIGGTWAALLPLAIRQKGRRR